MKRINISLVSLMLLATLFTLFSCSKTTLSYTQDGDWLTRAYFGGKARGEAVSFTIGNYAYVSTGYDPSNANVRLVDTWRFDPTGDYGTWKNQEADYPVGASRSTGRSQAVAFVVNGKAYVGSGYDGYSSLSDFFAFDPATNLWSPIASLGDASRQYPRYDAVAFGIGNFGYVTTGSVDANNVVNDTWQYDPAGDVWNSKASFPGTPRTQASAFTYDSSGYNRGYVVSGVSNNTTVSDFWRYDPSQPDANAWKKMADIANASTESFDDGYANIVRQNAVAFVMTGTKDGDCAFLTTGRNGSALTTTWEYIINTDRWKEKTPLEASSREGAVGFTIQNRGYVALGLSGATGLTDVLEFHPNDVQVANN